MLRPRRRCSMMRKSGEVILVPKVPSGGTSSQPPASSCDTATKRVASRWRVVVCGFAASAVAAAA
eukprot:scaffold26107_cov64-Phaeocystis_antarctica.AAC.2